MKWLKPIILCFVLFCSVNTKANEYELFSYNRDAIDKVLFDLNSLETIISNNPTITLNDALLEVNCLCNGTTLCNPSFGLMENPPLGIPSFLWGCFFGVGGLVVVSLITDGDKAEVKEALKGCIATYAVSILLYIAYRNMHEN